MKSIFLLLIASFATLPTFAAPAPGMNILFIFVEHLGYYTSERIAHEPLPEEKAINVGTGFGEYGDPSPQYAIDLHDETVRTKATQPLPYELLRQLCMGDAPKEELYDLDTDARAVKSPATDSARAAALEKMRAEMKHWREFTRDRNIHPCDIKRRTAKTTP